MTENDDRLIEQFLAPGRREVADNGFTRRVMNRLPRQSNRLAEVWTWSGFALALALFIALDGASLIWDALREAFHSMIEQGMASNVDPKSLLIAGVVLLFLAYKKIASLA